MSRLVPIQDAAKDRAVGSRHAPAIDLNSRPLCDLAPKRTFWKGAVIGVQGDPCDHLCIIAEGQVLLTRRNLDGHDYAFYLIGPHDMFAEGSLRPERRWLVTARAVTDATVHLLPAAQLPRFAQYFPHLMAHVITLLSGRLERAHRRLDLITTTCARRRVLGLLNVMCDFHGQAEGDGRWMPVHLSQLSIGEMVGLARETVARSLAELEREGLVRRDGRKGVWVRVPVDADAAPCAAEQPATGTGIRPAGSRADRGPVLPLST